MYMNQMDKILLFYCDCIIFRNWRKLVIFG